MLFTCIKLWFFRNHWANFHQISHWSYCWNVIDSLFKWLCSTDCQAHIFFFKTKNCSNDDLSIGCYDRIGKMLHNICISAVVMSLRWASRGPWASCLHSGGYLGVIVVRVYEPAFQNLPHPYTWPLKKWTHSYTWSSKMLTYSYTAHWFFVPIYCWLLDKYHSQFIEYQENKQPRKISERKICIYTKLSEKWGLSHRNPEKSGHSYTFYWKKGANHIPGSAEKGGYSARTSVLCHI